jgi:hypothetical protein
MSADYPSSGNILQTVRAFLEDLRPTLTGEQRFHAQVASYLLGIVLREQSALQEQSALSARLGLNEQEFRAALRSGALDTCGEELVALLLADAAREVAIVRPDHLAPEHRPGHRSET